MMSISGAKKPKLKNEDEDSEFGKDLDTLMEVEDTDPSNAEIEVLEFKARTPSYKILTFDTIFQNMIKIVEQAHEVIELPHATIMTLLNHVKWDKDKLLDAYYENSDKLFEEANVILPPTEVEKQSDPIDELNCGICFGDVSHQQCSALNCGHRFCNECWETYLNDQIMGHGKSLAISCPEPNCTIIVEHEIVKGILQSGDILQKYQSLITKTYVESNRKFRWCPAAGCNNAVCTDTPKAFGIDCSCGHSFCFLCQKDWHEPIQCDLLVKWLKKCNDDSETATWMQANTKDCPKCKTMIEKNGGCNHMTCRTTSCRHEFCWICMQDWKTHTGNAYQCNRFDEAKNNDASNARTSLNRYLHYFQRFNAHRQSLTFAAKLKDSVTQKMNQFQSLGNLSWVDVQFLTLAADALYRCRKTLMYTYGFAFFLVKNNQSEIFEDNQRDLESATEILSGFLENELIPDGNDPRTEQLVDMNKIKLKIVDSYSYCETRRKILIAHVQEGYEEDNENSWKYRF